MITIKIESIQEIKKVAQEFLRIIGDKKHFSFKGKMGAGKTTFIKSLCETLGVSEIVNSPTFSIVNEYETEKKDIIYHFDFYRINKIQEASDFGVEEYFESGNLCFMEWAENITPLLPDDVIEIEIMEKEDGSREINILI